MGGPAKAAVAIVAAALLMTGCSDKSGPSVTPPSATPTVVESTREEVASVIAEHAPKWREIVDGAGWCRFYYGALADNPTDRANAVVCWMQERTLSIQAKTVAERLESMTPPRDMRPLVDETTELFRRWPQDLEAKCGEGATPNKDKACDIAIGKSYGALRDLDSLLNRWGPYLGGAAR